MRFEIVPIQFAEILDKKTGKSRTRNVDLDSTAYQTAVEMQERITSYDLDDPDKLAAIARAANLTPEEARERYALP